MKKKESIILALIAVLLLTACSDSKPVPIDLSQIEYKTFEYQESEAIAQRINRHTFEISLPEGGYSSTYCVYKDTIYYSVDFIDHMQDPTGSRPDIKFEEKYSTEIRAYQIKTGEDTRLYQYEDERCVRVTDMQCNGEVLVWEDYSAEYTWNIKKLILNGSGKPENICSSNPEKGELSTVTLTLTEDGIYWYDMLGDSDKPVILYKYEEKKKAEIEQANLSLQSPYQHVSIVDNVSTTFENNDDNTSIIHIEDSQANTQLDLHVSGKVCTPVSNGEICVWIEGYQAYERQKLLIYHIAENTLEQIAAPDIFSYGMIKNLLLVKQKNGIYCYDVGTKEYKNLLKSEIEECGFTFQGLSNNVYAQAYGYRDGIKVINFSMNNEIEH